MAMQPHSRSVSMQPNRHQRVTSSALRQRQRATPSKQLISQVAATILQRRERLRVIEDGEDVTPRTLTDPQFASNEDRRTAFDVVQVGMSHQGSVAQLTGIASGMMPHPRASLGTVSSHSSIEDTDTVSVRDSYKGSLTLDEDDDAPSQFHLPRFESRERFQLEDTVTITMKETETFFLFELAQLTEDATTEIGNYVKEENQRYNKIITSIRKTVDAETQTPQRYTKTRGTYIGRELRRNRATFVNNWVMHDTCCTGKQTGAKGEPHEDARYKFSEQQTGDEPMTHRPPEDQLEALGKRESYADATRVTLRILASKKFEIAQKRFAGLLKQDPGDPELELVYALDVLWSHSCPAAENRPVSCFRWNPVNHSVLAAGYETRTDKSEEGAKGIVMIWCAKNPTEPDRCYGFNSAVSDLDWSTIRPHLLAIGFFDGTIRVIDVSKKELTIVRQSQKKTSPSYEPHWQVQWWLVANEPLDNEAREQLYASNQDGRVCYYPPDEDFASREILRLQRIEGKVPGVKRMNYCQGSDVPINRNPGALLLCRHPTMPANYAVGTEEGCVVSCATSHPHGHLGCFLAHDGPIYGMQYSPFCPRLFLTCGADWCIRVWVEGIEEPLLTFGTKMSAVMSINWSPRNSTIFASAVDNEICIWDIRRKTHRPASMTKIAEENVRVMKIEFTRSGEQLLASDDVGNIYVYGLVGMPLPPFDQEESLVTAVKKALLTKPELLRKLEKLGKPFMAKRDDV